MPQPPVPFKAFKGLVLLVQRITGDHSLNGVSCQTFTAYGGVWCIVAAPQKNVKIVDLPLRFSAAWVMIEFLLLYPFGGVMWGFICGY